MRNIHNQFSRLVFKNLLLAFSMFLSMFSLNTQAYLINFEANDGTELVFSTISDLSWVRDGNLLGTLMTQNGFSETVTAINNASSNFSVSEANFDNVYLGNADWEGGMAFIDYLNAVAYAGTSNWRLPIVIDTGYRGCGWSSIGGTECGYRVVTNGQAAGHEYAELYYGELNGISAPEATVQGTLARFNDVNDVFVNEINYVYWTGSEYVDPELGRAWYFGMNGGFQDSGSKEIKQYLWPVSAGRSVAAVPEPSSALMLLLGITALSLRFRHPLFASAKRL